MNASASTASISSICSDSCYLLMIAHPMYPNSCPYEGPTGLVSSSGRIYDSGFSWWHSLSTSCSEW
jgi:hypothetical protein